MHSSPPVVCLMGPTATGKTDLAIKLVQCFPVDIISVDSAMVYRDMNIGTAKPTWEELQKAPHRLIDLRDPADPYSVGDFRADVYLAIKAILQAGRIPLLVGGTMLYFHILQQGIASLPPANEAIRRALSTEAEKIGWSGMHQKLKLVDPDMAAQLHPNDSQRIQRALEITEITGQTMTKLQSIQIPQHPEYRFINIALVPKDRQYLHHRIAQRFSLMLARGFLGEVEQLWKRADLSVQLPSIRAVGYRQAWPYFDGKIDIDTLREQAIIATRQLAKRQLTWLRRWKNVMRFYLEEKKHYQQIRNYLTKEIIIEHRC